MIATNFERSVAGDARAREAMALASTYAGIGFGNAGARACAAPRRVSMRGVCAARRGLAAAWGFEAPDLGVRGTWSRLDSPCARL